ncbi:MAG: ComEC/Rec2 family competence protein [Candidatus Omnitrophica bacterium]|nr:ComEC/Rec2 family competence protein [Candidatus Omnitrophota bacterium]
MNNDPLRTENYHSVERPWFWVSVFFILGAAAANQIKLPFFILYLLCFGGLLFSFIFLLNKRIFFLCLVLSLSAFGFLRFQIASFVPDDNIGEFISEEKEKVIVEGFIADNPQGTVDRFKREVVEFLFETASLIKEGERIDVSGKLKVSVYNLRAGDFRYGDTFLLEGSLSRPRAPEHPQQFDYGEYLKRRGIYGLFYVNKKDGIVRLGGNKGKSLLKAAYCLKNNLKKKYASLLPPTHSAILSALILGDRKEIPAPVLDSFIHTGCVHILAISGLHVGLVILIILAIFRLTRVKAKAAVVLCICFLIFYCFLTGMRASVVRACIMGSLVLGAMVLERDVDLYNSLGLAAFCMLLFNPYQLFDVGFQLSFAAVLSIVYLTPKLLNFTGPAFELVKKAPLPWLRKTLLFTGQAACVSFSAWLGVMPLTLHYFHQASLVSVIANLFILPLLTISLALGFLVSVVSFLSFTLAKIFSESLWLTLFSMVKTAQIFEKIPCAFFHFEGVTAPLLFLYYGALLGLTFRLD